MHIGKGTPDSRTAAVRKLASGFCRGDLVIVRVFGDERTRSWHSRSEIIECPECGSPTSQAWAGHLTAPDEATPSRDEMSKFRICMQCGWNNVVHLRPRKWLFDFPRGGAVVTLRLVVLG